MYQITKYFIFAIRGRQNTASFNHTVSEKVRNLLIYLMSSHQISELSNFLKSNVSIADILGSTKFCAKRKWFYTNIFLFPTIMMPQTYKQLLIWVISKLFKQTRLHSLKIDFYFHTMLKLRPKSIQTKIKYLLFEKKCNA